MPDDTAASTSKPETPAERIQRRKEKLRHIRDRAAKLFADGAQGMQIASMISEQLDEFAASILDESLASFPEADRKLIKENSAMIAIGGSGRGEVSPYSDADLLFLYRPQIAGLFGQFSKRFVAEFWDAGIKLGHRVHTVNDAVARALEDPHLASSLVHIRALWGDDSLATLLRHRSLRKVMRRRLKAFIDDCVAGREDERKQHGATTQQLEPDVKRSMGGLRDVHLLQWLAFAHYQTADIDTLRKRHALSTDDAVRLKTAVEYLTKVRIDLHLHAGRGNDILTKEEQLRIAESRSIAATEGQKPVERFMQEYFTHSTAIAEITKRFVARHRPRTVTDQLKRSVVSPRVNRHFVLNGDELDVLPSRLNRVCTTLDDILRIYHSAAMYRVSLSPRLTEHIKATARNLPSGPSPEAARLFMEILGTIGRLSSTLRSMHETNVLELIIPEWQRVRCLLQFNQYHHFTVDEHTLQCLEICEGFADEDTPVGAALRSLHSPELLFLTLLLHDAGKGFEEDHSEVGRRLALDVCRRLRLDEDQADIVSFLIHKHLVMADLAFRRDTTDQRLVLTFSHELGTPERLRMLYVLTAADVSGVGPGVWNNWKSDLLTDFYKRLMLTLSGQPPQFHEEERLREIRDHVYRSIVPVGPGPNADELTDSLQSWVDEQLDGFRASYLLSTPPARIAADLDTIRNLEPGEIHVEGRYQPESGAVEYRIITDSSHEAGCFHQITGVLTARHCEILGADITTSLQDVIVDVFHVIDRDFSGEVPQHRIDEIAASIRDVLHGRITVEELFQKHQRYVGANGTEPVMELPTRVEIDSRSSEYGTIVSVFAHDQPGLLYTVSRKLFELGLSIELARIATHFDQVVDVFYVTDNDGNKVAAEDRTVVRDGLYAALCDFEAETHNEFVS
ncbi:MAG: [protein-PII] uridylyltransferase [Planctomycetota bacterium]|jgi:[protein-PII] uridylyltransferase